MDRIQDLCDRIAREFHPERIILFGSYARGDADEDSDVDLLVIMPFEGTGARKATEIRKRTRPGFPIDLIVRTPETVRERIELGDFFLREAVEEGKVLYDAAYA
jgi:predicted nucleotidyltransferase